MRLLLSLVFVAAAAVSSVAACSSSSSSDSGSCSSNPFTCGAGQTCSVKDQSGTFACLTSGTGTKGSACQNTVGVTTCGDGLVCLQLVQAGGTCASFCEPGNTAHGCAAGETCAAAKLAGTSETFFVCAGGAPADAGATDAATD
jgi:hypothetical protein